MNKSIFSSIKWIYFISRRFSKVDSKGRSAATSLLASLGVCAGVTALIVVMSVMNGFQMEFVDAILEISSYHVRVEQVSDSLEDEFKTFCRNNKTILSITLFSEVQGLLVSERGIEQPALVRSVPNDIRETDVGFAKEMMMISGSFNISKENSIVLGNTLAQNLGARVGSEITLMALSGSGESALFSRSEKYTVVGIFYSNYADINSTYAFISEESGKNAFDEKTAKIYGLKLKDSSKDGIIISEIEELFPSIKADSWRAYNRSFFGALRVEKNLLMLLVFLIFVVVAVNIYNGMHRMVYERIEEIAVLSALGASPSEVQAVFIVRGFLTGILGAIPGLLLGLFLCVNMPSVFILLSKIQFGLQYFIALCINPSEAAFIAENPMFKIYAGIPARMVFTEILAIFIFGIASSLVASFLASLKSVKCTIAEVLRDE